MNIQGLNPLTSLSNSEAAGGQVTSFLNDAGSSGVFSATLLEQLAQLQNSLVNNPSAGTAGLADLQQLGAFGPDTIGMPNVQEFAALLGSKMPAASKAGQDIDLDDTLKTLADVLQYLQGLEGNPPAMDQSSSLLSGAADSKGFTEIEAQNAEDASQQAALTAGLQAQSALQADVRDHVDDVLKSAVETGRAMSAIQKNREALVADIKSEGLGGVSDGQSTKSEGGAFGIALAAENDAGGTNQGNSTGNPSGESAPSLKAHGLDGDAGAGLARVTADLQQLSKLASSGNTVAVPGMNTHLSHPEWKSELGEKLLWMHKQSVPSAEIRLNPEHLGPISIKIDVNQDQAVVAFTAQHAAVKDAIEAAIPKLREMLGGQNLNLADVNVSQQHTEQRQGRDFFQAAGEQSRNRNGDSDQQASATGESESAQIRDEIEAGRAIAANGLLSLFA